MRDAAVEVEVGPRLLPFNDKHLPGKTANRATEARVDIRAMGFWTRQQNTFFNVRVTHPKANLLTVAEAKRQLEKNDRERESTPSIGKFSLHWSFLHTERLAVRVHGC